MINREAFYAEEPRTYDIFRTVCEKNKTKNIRGALLYDRARDTVRRPYNHACSLVASARQIHDVIHTYFYLKRVGK